MNRRWLISRLIPVGLIATTVALTGCTTTQHSRSQTTTDAADDVAMNQELTVFRSPSCTCCSQWVAYMEAAGFQVRDNVTEDITAIKDQYGVPANLASCHTTVVNGYVVEGHVPAEDVQRLLVEEPVIVGIAVPGMPIGSPGMESGNYVEPYTVFSFTNSGEVTVFAEHL
ncbi:DUF411 domain-containing protein [Vacuolonema iberomarrocanum]|uniref:DUF411 domain-containing protein n=1 Tax=Vacuolonema iberomarrocanum TaxID=3454632 RepID=UPI0019EB03FE|nr:DUF411 domain-containing protein [filamentous cyanobacterium LEGE 07170]